MSLEEKIIQKFKEKKIENPSDGDTVYFNRPGVCSEIGQRIEISNLDDFPQSTHETIHQLIRRPMGNSKEFLFTEVICGITKDGIMFEGVLDTLDKSYVFKNIIVKISGITFIRVKTDNLVLDGDMFDINDETLFCYFEDNMIHGSLYETGIDFVSNIEEAVEMDKKLLKTVQANKISGQNKKIRFDSKTGKLYIR